jgi:peptidoglycan/LPS O-acetylase OafA/YrhL
MDKTLLSDKREHRRDIQVLRGLAVLAVVFFHTEESFIPLGFLGVDVFFVISGFVITPLIIQIFTKQILIRERLSNLKYFYKRRFYRLAPALGVTLLTSAVLTFLMAPIFSLEQFSGQGIAALLISGNLGAYKYNPNYFSLNSNQLIHTWSLSIEEQIYVILPLIFLLIFSIFNSTKNRIFNLLLLITTISLVISLSPIISAKIYTAIGIYSPSLFSFYSPIERIYQFTLGSLGYVISDGYPSRVTKVSKYFNWIVLVIILLFFIGLITIEPKFASIFISLATLFIIMFRSLGVLPNKVSKKMEWIGDRSYSIYLIHLPLIYIAKFSPLIAINNSENRSIQSALAVAATIFLGSISYSKIENRFRYPSQTQSSIAKFVLVFTFLPLLVYILIYIGTQNKFWGLDRNITRPPAAWQIDSKCDRFSVNGFPCTYTNSGAKKTVLLLGDSHAIHLSQAVIDVAKSQNWDAAIWGGTSCIFEAEICQDKFDRIIEWIEFYQPKVVIVSYFIQPDVTQSKAINTLPKLKSKNRSILLIGNNPIFPDNKTYMQSANSILTPPYEPPKYFAKSMMVTKYQDSSDRLVNFAKNNGIFTLDLESVFCDKNNCFRYLNGEWLYNDANHLSIKGADLIVPNLKSFFRQF